MKVLVNAAPIIKGGGVQVAASFACEASKHPSDIEWHFALSAAVANEVENLGVHLENSTVIGNTPVPDGATRKRLLWDGAKRKRLLALEAEIAPDAVFTVFGPTYVRFKAPHLLGVAVGWVTHSTWLAFQTVNGWPARARRLAESFAKGLALYSADRWVVEAPVARDGLHSRYRIPKHKIDVVQNSCAAVFNEAKMAAAVFPADKTTIRLVYVSAYYPHKDFRVIPRVAAELKKADPNRHYEFVLTLPPEEPGLDRIINDATRLGVKDCIVNVGPVTLHEIIELYRDIDICFMPSLLETFSANYPEAMALGRPIVATNLPFATDVCGEAAEYFEPSDGKSAAQAIMRLLGNEAEWQQKIAAGRAALAALPTAEQKYEQYVAAIRKIVE